MARVIDLGKRNVLGVLVDAVDYDAAVARILTAARERQGFAATALAVHGVMTGVDDPVHAYRLNHFDLVTPDGQPVRWGLNLLYRTDLTDKVSGPTLMVRLCEAAAAEGLSIFLYGSRRAVLDRLEAGLRRRFPGLLIAGTEPSRFRRVSREEKEEIAERIRCSGAALTFVGLGCPRQEIFAYEYRATLQMPVVAVGAAFDYHAGILREPPMFVQRAGLQWVYRLAAEPRRLWKRYTVVSASYVARLTLQALRLTRPDPAASTPPVAEMMFA